MTVDAFWIDGGRRHCSVFVLGLFCSISHGSTLRLKGWTNPTIHSKVFVFVLVRSGCGRGASALPLNASESSLTAREGAPFCCGVVWRGAAPSNVCAAGPPKGRSAFCVAQRSSGGTFSQFPQLRGEQL